MKKDLNDLLITLNENLNKTKNDINTLLEEKYNDLKPLISKSEKYQKQIEYLNDQIEIVRVDIENKEILINHPHKVNDYKYIIDRIDNFKKAVDILDSLQAFESVLVELINAIDAKQYKKCNNYLNQLEQFFQDNLLFNKNIDSEQLNLVKYLKEEFLVQKERLFYEIDLHWDKFIAFNDLSHETISIKIDSSGLISLFNEINGTILDKNTLFKTRFNDFCAKLMKLFEKIIATNVQIEENEKMNLNIQTFNGSTDTVEAKFDNIKQILGFLNENLFSLKGNLKENLIDNKFLEKFLNLIYNNLILSSIKITEYNQDDMKLLCELVAQFQSFLSKINLFDRQFLEQNKTANLLFKEFQANVKYLYIQKKCRYVLDRSRDLMKSPKLIFELIKVKNSQDEDFKISQIVKQIVELVKQTLDEALKFYDDDKSSSNSRNICLLCLAARNIIDLYIDVVPCFHKKDFSDLPILSTIAFNDFNYLSDSCLDLIPTYKLILNIDDSKVNLIDLVPKLKLVGSQLLESQIDKQSLILNEYIDGLNRLTEISESNNFKVYEKAVKECNLHLNSLASLWRDILPKIKYFQVFGQFYDLIFKRLIGFILNFEDISTDDANYFILLLNLFKSSLVKIFNDEPMNNDDVDSEELSFAASKINVKTEKYIKSWMRYKYLIEILNANLQKIVDLWSESKGPLALYFTSDEIRHLIRALFMITDKRATALSKIY